MVAVTANAVLLPFVCMRCDETGLSTTSFGSLAGGDQEADVDYSFSYDQDAFRDNATVAQFYEDMAPASENEPLTEEGASIENTTALIADLEAQLVAVKKDRDELDNEVEAMQNDLIIANETITELNLRINRAEYNAELLALRVKNLADSRDFYKNEQSDVRLRLSLERNKSWWTKLWEG
jgi:chromosome segregation ATPase